MTGQLTLFIDSTYAIKSGKSTQADNKKNRLVFIKKRADRRYELIIPAWGGALNLEEIKKVNLIQSTVRLGYTTLF